MEPLSRRNLFRTGAAAAGGLVFAGALAGCSSDTNAALASSTTTTMPTNTPDEALARLMAGNARYAAGQPLSQARDSVRRASVADTQSPFAVILSCADSRVSPEVLFDAGVGDLFVVRVAGNTGTTPVVQGSIEYAIEHLHSMVLMVLGHQGCGAVKAALGVAGGDPMPDGQIGAFVEPVLPAAQSVKTLPKDQQLEAAIKQNVLNQTSLLSGLAPVLQPIIASGKVKVVGGEYQLASGKVELLG